MSKQLVEQVKAQLEAQGKDLSGPCGAFAITKRVAWALRAQGFGLLSKPSGNNCEGFSVDYVVDANGGFYDILSDAGGANGPQWPDGPSEFDKSRWRAPIDPQDAPVPEPQPIPTPVPQPVPVPQVECKFQPCNCNLNDVVAALAQLVEALDAQSKKLDEVATKQDRELVGKTRAFGGEVVLKPRG